MLNDDFYDADEILRDEFDEDFDYDEDVDEVDFEKLKKKGLKDIDYEIEEAEDS